MRKAFYFTRFSLSFSAYTNKISYRNKFSSNNHKTAIIFVSARVYLRTATVAMAHIKAFMWPPPPAIGGCRCWGVGYRIELVKRVYIFTSDKWKDGPNLCIEAYCRVVLSSFGWHGEANRKTCAKQLPNEPISNLQYWWCYLLLASCFVSTLSYEQHHREPHHIIKDVVLYSQSRASYNNCVIRTLLFSVRLSPFHVGR